MGLVCLSHQVTLSIHTPVILTAPLCPSKKSLKAKFQLEGLVEKKTKMKLLSPQESILYIRKKGSSLDFRSLMRGKKLAGKYNMKQWIRES